MKAKTLVIVSMLMLAIVPFVAVWLVNYLPETEIAMLPAAIAVESARTIDAAALPSIPEEVKKPSPIKRAIKTQERLKVWSCAPSRELVQGAGVVNECQYK